MGKLIESALERNQTKCLVVGLVAMARILSGKYDDKVPGFLDDCETLAEEYVQKVEKAES